MQTHLYFQYAYRALFTLNVKIPTFSLRSGVGQSLCIPQRQLLSDDSQPVPVGGELPDFSFIVKAGRTQGECTCHRSLYFWTDHQWCWPREPAGELVYLSSPPYGLSFYVGKTKLKFTTCFGTRLGIYCDEQVGYITELSRHWPFLPSTIQGEILLLPKYYSLPGCVFSGEGVG